MANKELVIALKRLHPTQQEIVNHPARFKVVVLGRRSGKTELGKDVIVLPALEKPAPYAIFQPTYKMLRDVWEAMKNTLHPVIKRVNEQEKRLELITGSSIDMWSLDSADGARGRKYQRVVVDECGVIPLLEYAWNEVIRPTLTDLRGDAYFLGTPKGRNFFWVLYNRGIDPTSPEWAAWRYPTTCNPYIDPREIEAAKQDMPERSFMQEYMAEFLEDSGSVFRGVSEIATAQPQEPDPSASYVGGLDWARSEDFTVLIILNEKTRTVAHMERFNQVSWELQRGRVKAVCEKFKPRLVLAELNSIGDPNVEALQRDNLPVEGFTTTNTSKGQIIDALALAIERKEITVLNDPVLKNELMSYEMERLPSGNWRYGAASGGHDDTVIALALAHHAAGMRPAVAQNIMLSNSVPKRGR